MRADLGDFQRVISHSNFFLLLLLSLVNSISQKKNEKIFSSSVFSFSYSILPLYLVLSLFWLLSLRDELPFDGY
jgi:hypothetical protein